MLRQQKPRIFAIYEDDFNFLSKMCLTRMRELAWQLARCGAEGGYDCGRSWVGCDRSRREYLRNGVDFVLLGEAEQSLVELCASILPGWRAYRT